MSTSQQSSRVSSLTKSIDSVLETIPTPPPVRPLAALRPSWIGPARAQRSVTPGIETMKQTVRVEFSSPGLQPPVYIFTDLSDPQWEAVEMECTKNGEGECAFSKVFRAEEGEYQYKFRLGDGDWWMCDHGKPIVDDGQGNRNNLLVVKADTPAPKVDPAKSVHKDDQTLPPPPVTAKASEAAPLLKHEATENHIGSAAEQTPEREEPNAFEVNGEEPDMPNGHVPLLRHESVKPSSVEQDHSPLFRHESISIGNNHHETPRKPSIVTPTESPPIPEEADTSDESLHRFPSDHAGILNEIKEASKRSEPNGAVLEEDVHINEVDIEEEIVIEIVEEPQGLLDRLTEKVGGAGNAMALVLAVLTVAAGMLAMRFR